MSIFKDHNHAMTYLQSAYDCDLYMHSWQVSKELLISITHVGRLCREGVLPAVRILGRWKIETWAVANAMVNGLTR